MYKTIETLVMTAVFLFLGAMSVWVLGQLLSLVFP